MNKVILYAGLMFTLFFLGLGSYLFSFYHLGASTKKYYDLYFNKKTTRGNKK